MATLKTREYLIKYTVNGARGVDAQKIITATNAKTAIKMIHETTPAHMELEIRSVWEQKATGSTTVERKNTIKFV